MANIAYALQALVINGTTVTGIKSYGIDQREQLVSLGADGVLHRSFHAVKRAAPSVDFTTAAAKSLATLLSNTDSPMVKITSNADLFFAAQDVDKPGLASSGHKGLRAAAGHVYLTGLRWAAGGDGLEASGMILPTSSDGTTAPLADIGSPTLPTAAAIEVLTLTSATLGGQTLGRVTSAEITIDPKADTAADACFLNGLPYPTTVLTAGAAGPVAISATIETLDQVVAPSGTGTLVLVFSQFDFGGVPGSTTMTVTLNGGMIREVSRSAQQGSPSTRRYQILPRLSGGTKPLTIA